MQQGVYETEDAGRQVVLNHRKYKPTELELIVYLENCGVSFNEMRQQNHDFEDTEEAREEERLDELTLLHRNVAEDEEEGDSNKVKTLEEDGHARASLLKRYRAFHRSAEESLLKIARSAWSSPLPRDLALCLSEGGTEAGEVYFFDFKTGESSWLHPDAALHARILSKARSRIATKEDIFQKLFSIVPNAGTAGISHTPPETLGQRKASTTGSGADTDPLDFTIEDDTSHAVIVEGSLSLPPVPADLAQGRWERLLTPRGTRMFLANLETGEVVQAHHPSQSSNSGSTAGTHKEKIRRTRKLREADAIVAAGGDSEFDEDPVPLGHPMSNKTHKNSMVMAALVSPHSDSNHPHPLRQKTLHGVLGTSSPSRPCTDQSSSAMTSTCGTDTTTTGSDEQEDEEEEEEYTSSDGSNSDGSGLSGTVFQPEDESADEEGATGHQHHNRRVGQQEVLTSRGHSDPTDSELEDYATWLGIRIKRKTKRPPGHMEGPRNILDDEKSDGNQYQEEQEDEGEEGLMWIAFEGLTQPCPKPWKLVKDTESSQTYYFNFDTGESEWDHPLDAYYRGLVTQERERRGTRPTATQQEVVGDADGETAVSEEAGDVSPKLVLPPEEEGEVNTGILPVREVAATAKSKASMHVAHGTDTSRCSWLLGIVCALGAGVVIGVQISKRNFI